MIDLLSNQTILSLLLAVLLAAGMWTWRVKHFDECDRFAADQSGTPVSVMVQSGTRTISVPCSIWVMRQPQWVQGIFGLLLVLVVIFVISLWSDVKEAAEGTRK